MMDCSPHPAPKLFISRGIPVSPVSNPEVETTQGVPLPTSPPKIT